MQISFHEIGINVNIIVSSFSLRFLQINKCNDVFMIEESLRKFLKTLKNSIINAIINYFSSPFFT